jgi:hypothetical protein
MNKLEEFQTEVLNLLKLKSPEHVWTLSTRIGPEDFAPRSIIYKDGVIVSGLYLHTYEELKHCYNITIDEIVDSIVNTVSEQCATPTDNRDARS